MLQLLGSAQQCFLFPGLANSGNWRQKFGGPGGGQNATGEKRHLVQGTPKGQQPEARVSTLVNLSELFLNGFGTTLEGLMPHFSGGSQSSFMFPTRLCVSM